MSLDSGSDFLTWCPDINLSSAYSWRLQTAQFGDGYKQRTLDGINALELEFQVSYSNRSRATLNAMIAYLAATQAVSFDFRDPGTGLVVRVFCDEWNVSYEMLSGDEPRGALTATFVRVNGVTA